MIVDTPLQYPYRFHDYGLVTVDRTPALSGYYPQDDPSIWESHWADGFDSLARRPSFSGIDTCTAGVDCPGDNVDSGSGTDWGAAATAAINAAANAYRLNLQYQPGQYTSIGPGGQVIYHQPGGSPSLNPVPIFPPGSSGNIGTIAMIVGVGLIAVMVLKK
jgi:hypothetical protein